MLKQIAIVRRQRSMPCFLPVVNGQDIEHDVQVGRQRGADRMNESDQQPSAD